MENTFHYREHRLAFQMAPQAPESPAPSGESAETGSTESDPTKDFEDFLKAAEDLEQSIMKNASELLGATDADKEKIYAALQKVSELKKERADDLEGSRFEIDYAISEAMDAIKAAENSNEGKGNYHVKETTEGVDAKYSKEVVFTLPEGQEMIISWRYPRTVTRCERRVVGRRRGPFKLPIVRNVPVTRREQFQSYRYGIKEGHNHFTRNGIRVEKREGSNNYAVKFEKGYDITATVEAGKDRFDISSTKGFDGKAPEKPVLGKGVAAESMLTKLIEKAEGEEREQRITQLAEFVEQRERGINGLAKEKTEDVYAILSEQFGGDHAKILQALTDKRGEIVSFGKEAEKIQSEETKVVLAEKIAKMLKSIDEITHRVKLYPAQQAHRAALENIQKARSLNNQDAAGFDFDAASKVLDEMRKNTKEIGKGEGGLRSDVEKELKALEGKYEQAQTEGLTMRETAYKNARDEHGKNPTEANLDDLLLRTEDFLTYITENDINPERNTKAGKLPLQRILVQNKQALIKQKSERKNSPREDTDTIAKNNRGGGSDSGMFITGFMSY